MLNVIVLEREVAKLAVDPAGTGAEEAVARLKLSKNELLEHTFCVNLVGRIISHMSGKKTKGVHESFFVAHF